MTTDKTAGVGKVSQDVDVIRTAKLLVDRLLEEVSQISGGTLDLNWEELPDGDLRIKVDADTQEEIKDKLAEGVDQSYIFDVLGGGPSGGMSGNGFDFVRPEEINALTDSPLIAYDVVRDDEGKLKVDNATKIWWYPGYQTRNPLQDLAEKGEVIFKKAGHG